MYKNLLYIYTIKLKQQENDRLNKIQRNKQNSNFFKW